MITRDIVELGKKYGWELRDKQPNDPTLAIFVRGKEQVNIWYTRMTVATIVPHPKYAGERTQLYRKHVTMDQLEKIFSKPRVHTGRGYFDKYGGHPKKKENNVSDFRIKIGNEVAKASPDMIIIEIENKDLFSKIKTIISATKKILNT